MRSGERSVSHTRNQLEAAVRAKRSIEAIELIPEVHECSCHLHIISESPVLNVTTVNCLY